MKPSTNTPNNKSHPLSEDLHISWIPSKTVVEQNDQITFLLIHEIRNPLTTINLALGTLRSTTTDASSRMYLDIIRRGANRINELVNSLLLSSGTIGQQPEEHSIHQLLNEVLQTTEDRVLLKNITVNRVYDQKDYKAILNRETMKVALTNIIVNAIAAMSSKNGQLKLATRAETDEFVVEIEDNGHGISKKNMKSIFEPYFTTKQDGIGLGLSTSLDTLVSNNVRIGVRSKEGKGTQFILSFSSRDKSTHPDK